MIQNVKNIDRLVRLSIGGILLIIFFASNLVSPLLSYGLPILGGILMVTAITGFCPIYAVFNHKKRGA